MDDQANEVTQFQKRVCSWTMSSVLVLALVLLFFQEKAIAKGLILGACFSISNFFLLGRFIPLTLGRSLAKARFISLTSILSRYILLAIPMILALKLTSLNFVATVVGIFAVQIVMLFAYIVVRPILTGR